jgi:hypothetical protein
LPKFITSNTNDNNTRENKALKPINNIKEEKQGKINSDANTIGFSSKLFSQGSNLNVVNINKIKNISLRDNINK